MTAKDVLIVRDVIDTGLSTRYAADLVAARHPRSTKVATLLDRPQRRILSFVPDYVGRVVNDDFLVGYGLDFAERYRNLGAIYAADPGDLDADPVAFEDAVYRSGVAFPSRPVRE